jgi:hypothetical protein
MYRRHGLATGDRHILNTWKGMMARCYRETFPSFKNYGARGIRVFDGWREDPAAFAGWLAENLGPRPEGHTLDRIDSDGNYEPGNLRWASRSEQSHNTARYREARGAELNKRTGKWQARIHTEGRRVNLGTFITEEEAHAAYLAYRKEHHHER